MVVDLLAELQLIVVPLKVNLYFIILMRNQVNELKQEQSDTKSGTKS